jgi:micrococcal nuclease
MSSSSSSLRCFLGPLLAGCLLLVACRSDDQRLTSEPTTTTTTVSAAGPATSTPTSTTTARDSTSASAEAGAAVVTDVVDGDTIDVRVDGATETVRIVGINTPEQGECLADEATRWLRDRISGRTVTLVRDESDRDRYGRLLRYVEVDGADVGVELVRAGLAIARRYPPDTARAAELDIVQAAAEDDGVGMWAPDACGTGTTADVVISEIRFDAAGNDNENLSDEWVRITNRGGGRVDLDGWVLKDESASHRYSFPSGFGLDAGATVTVRTGCGTDSAGELHWCMDGSAVWNNSGDTAFLLDPAGNIVDSRSG